MKLRRGRQAPTWTDVPDFVTWLVKCPVSRELYRLLKMHVNISREDDSCWPTLSSLASLLNLSREDKVNPYLKKLIDAKLVDKHREGMPARNVYVIHDLPPDGWTGTMSLSEWYAKRKATGEGVIPTRPRRGKAANPDKAETDAPVPPNLGVQEQGSLVPPNSGVQVPTDGGVLVPPNLGVEQELLEGVLTEVNKTEDQQPPPPPPRTAAPRSDSAKTEEEGGNPEDPELHDTAMAVLGDVQTAGHAPRRVRGPQAVELRNLVVAALRLGWTPKDLTTEISGELISARSVFGALRHRLQPENLGPPPKRAPAPAQRQPCTFGCVDAVVTVGEGSDVKGLACPSCKPAIHARQRAQFAESRLVPVDSVTFDDLRRSVLALAGRL